jgi:hypothetical protein
MQGMEETVAVALVEDTEMFRALILAPLVAMASPCFVSICEELTWDFTQ